MKWEQCLKKNLAVCCTALELFDSSHDSFICLCVKVLKLFEVILLLFFIVCTCFVHGICQCDCIMCPYLS